MTKFFTFPLHLFGYLSLKNSLKNFIQNINQTEIEKKQWEISKQT